MIKNNKKTHVCTKNYKWNFQTTRNKKIISNSIPITNNPSTLLHKSINFYNLLKTTQLRFKSLIALKNECT